MADRIVALEKRLGDDTDFETLQKRTTVLEDRIASLEDELGVMNPGKAGVGATQNAGEIVPVESRVPIDGSENWEELQRRADDARILAGKKDQSRMNGSPNILRIHETQQG